MTAARFSSSQIDAFPLKSVNARPPMHDLSLTTLPAKNGTRIITVREPSTVRFQMLPRGLFGRQKWRYHKGCRKRPKSPLPREICHHERL